MQTLLMKASELKMLWKLVKAGEDRPLSAADLALLLRLRFALQDQPESAGALPEETAIAARAMIQVNLDEWSECGMVLPRLGLYIRGCGFGPVLKMGRIDFLHCCATRH